MDSCSPPGSSVHGNPQARILEWVAIPSCRGSSLFRDRTRLSYVSCIRGYLPLVPPGKPLTKLDSVLKSRDITLPAKVHIAKAMVFPVVVSGCESWNIKKSEHWRTYAFKSWCWRRFLRVPWTAWRSNQSIVKEINPEYSLERLMLKLKLNTSVTWSEEPTHWKRPWFWKRLKN